MASEPLKMRVNASFFRTFPPYLTPVGKVKSVKYTVTHAKHTFGGRHNVPFSGAKVRNHLGKAHQKRPETPCLTLN